MQNAIEIPTREVLSFVLAHVPDRARILEVGAGRGHLAEALAANDHRVIAIDPNEEAVLVARSRGVDARVGRFPEEEIDGELDALLFTRVLHHVHELDRALERACELLAPGGALIVDEFAWERVDARTAAWAYGTMSVLASAGFGDEDRWAHDGDPLAEWKRKHTVDHELHSADGILRAVRARFEIVEAVEVPYFYRYVCQHQSDDPRAFEVTRTLRDLEGSLARAGAIVPIGLRFAARKIAPAA
jgi:SAM-dependent methyltransferase